MTRLPTPGQDSGQWGTILNDYLSQVHTESGNLKPGVVSADHIADSTITTTKIDNQAVTTDKLASGAVTGSRVADGSIASTKLDTTAQTNLAKADTALTLSQTHATRHSASGADPITPAAIGAAPELTDHNASATPAAKALTVDGNGTLRVGDGVTQGGVIAGGGAFEPRAAGALVVPLDIPTPDDDPSITHPSVVDAVAETGSPFAGHRYWMAASPYPAGARENPCIYWSEDLATWHVPTGLTNPIYSYAAAVAEGYDFNSDPCLRLVDGVLRCFFRTYRGPLNPSGSAELLRYSDSADGVTWSAPVTILEATGDNDVYMSPAILREDDGTWTMWAVDDNLAGANRCKRYTNGDLGPANWSAGAAVTLPTSSTNIWHIDVQRAGGLYHMLAQNKTTFELVYRSSTDGVTWAGSAVGGSIQKSGLAYDTRGFYKSAFVPRHGGNGLRWDVLAAGLDGSGVDAWDDVMRIALVRDVNLAAGFDEGRQRQLWIPATQMYASLGTPAVTLVDSRYPLLSYDAASNEGAVTLAMVPPAWATARLTLYWANLGAGAGTVVWAVTTAAKGANNQLDSTNEVAELITATAGTVNRVVVTETTTALNCFYTTVYQIRVNRAATDAADTLGNDAGLIGIKIERLS